MRRMPRALMCGSPSAKAEFLAFNYDPATPQPVAEAGLSTFARFMDDPFACETILSDAQAAAVDAFKQQ
jgi:hypothetical protein